MHPPNHRLKPVHALLMIVTLCMLSGCWQADEGPLPGRTAPVPSDFSFIGRSSACLLELPDVPRSIRVNCFHVDGVLHIHSNRFAKWPRLRGESWVDTVQRQPEVRVAMNGQIYALNATPLRNETQRVALLKARGYWIAWNGITVFAFEPRPDLPTSTHRS